MGRIPDIYIDPIGLFFIKIATILSPYFYKLHFTPNQITTVSLLFGIAAIYFLRHKTVAGAYLFAFLYLIQFLFDCMDGIYARRYNMMSKFGGYYDHTKDFLLFIVICYIFVVTYQIYKYPLLCVMIIVLAILQHIYHGCHNRFYVDQKDEDESMMIGIKICHEIGDKHNRHNLLSALRWVGSGTLITYIGIVAIYLTYHQRPSS